MSILRFEWDFAKAESNFSKHGVEFDEARSVFGDPLSITSYDVDHSTTEERFITVGSSRKGRLLIVAHADYGDSVRIISARKLNRLERMAYENEIKKRAR